MCVSSSGVLCDHRSNTAAAVTQQRRSHCIAPNLVTSSQRVSQLATALALLPHRLLTSHILARRPRIASTIQPSDPVSWFLSLLYTSVVMGAPAPVVCTIAAYTYMYTEYGAGLGDFPFGGMSMAPAAASSSATSTTTGVKGCSTLLVLLPPPARQHVTSYSESLCGHQQPLGGAGEEERAVQPDSLPTQEHAVRH